MYLYVLEKTLSNEYTMADITELNKLMTNSDNIHHLLGKLFNVNNEENWRSKYNILYKVDTSTTFKLKVKSDIQIDKKVALENKIKVLDEKEISIKNNQEITVKLEVSPFRKDGGQKNKKIIKTTKERKDWLKNKLTYNGECEVKEINELGQVAKYMEHPDKLKGAAMLNGFSYEIKLTVRDAEGFKKLMQIGVGPQKAYGFGLLEIA